ncbi:hypothetical protein BDQ17DRAFT_584676 [Cyathus striatus]|nr:hypothetical protein BDQ17DRAFT_584676 [Cyathus striatus]
MSTSAEVPQITSALPKQDGRHAPSPALSCETENLFTTYASPFEWYPLLHSHSRTISGQLTPIEQTSSSSSSNSVSNAPVFPASLSSAVFPVSSVYPSSLSHPSIPTSSSSSSSSSNFPLPNLKPLKLTAAAKLLDPCKRICQYEVPGGGVCRDAGCKDLHLSRTLGPSTGGVSGIGGFEPNDQDAAEYLFNTLPADWLSGHGISSSKILTALQEVRLKNMPIAFEERVAQALCALGPPPLPPPAT